MMKRANAAATHYQHVDRVHPKRLIELAKPVDEHVVPVEQMSLAELHAEQQLLVGAMERLENELNIAKAADNLAEIATLGNRMQSLMRRKGACRLRWGQLKGQGLDQTRTSLKQAMREMLPPETVAAIIQRANEIRDAVSGQQPS